MNQYKQDDEEMTLKSLAEKFLDGTSRVFCGVYDRLCRDVPEQKKELRTPAKRTYKMGAVAAIGLTAILALNSCIGVPIRTLKNYETKMTGLGNRIEQIDKRLNRIDDRLDDLEPQTYESKQEESDVAKKLNGEK